MLSWQCDFIVRRKKPKDIEWPFVFAPEFPPEKIVDVHRKIIGLVKDGSHGIAYIT